MERQKKRGEKKVWSGNRGCLRLRPPEPVGKRPKGGEETKNFFKPLGATNAQKKQLGQDIAMVYAVCLAPGQGGGERKKRVEGRKKEFGGVVKKQKRGQKTCL